MVSRQGTCGGFVLVLPKKSSTCRVLESGAWYKWFKSLLLAQGCLLKLVDAEVWGKEMAPAPSHIPIGQPPLSGKPSQKSNLSSCVLGIPLIAALTPSVCGLSASPEGQCTCVLSEAGWLRFKTQNFRNLAWGSTTLILWRRVSLC